MGSIKLQYGEELRRLSKPPHSYEELKRQTEAMFEIEGPIFAYQDEDNDTITVSSQPEYQGALDFAAGKPLKLQVLLSDPGLSESFIPVQADMALSRSRAAPAFNARGSYAADRGSLREPIIEQPIGVPKQSEVRHSDRPAANDLQRGSLAIDEDFKQSIREALREELSEMIVKPKITSNDVFNYFCSGCKFGPIPKVIYLCVNCPFVHLCEACEESADHEHALVKIKSESMMSQVAEYTRKMLAGGLGYYN
mmetsp:Transcript_32915/g.57574  ORF Transcript_32915/g.57574 Transcript_32915/m.57574 type:complete len:252 (+) Transcript_32915:9208-9963(+)